MAAVRGTCTACSLLCDDLLVAQDRLSGGCEHGRRAIAAAAAGEAAEPAAEAYGASGPLDRRTALAEAATCLVSARRVLVTGLAAVPLEAVLAACDLAEDLGAAVDAEDVDCAAAAGPTIARAGAVTAAWEELRDRCDLVIFWHCDPSHSHPRFMERFVAPAPASSRPRRTITVGPAVVPGMPAPHRHVHVSADADVEAACCLAAAVGGSSSAVLDESLAAACATLGREIAAAACVAIVTDTSADTPGLAAWSVATLVRRIAHVKPAFQIPLGPGVAGSGPNASGAAAVCTWRYGASGAIARADRRGGNFLPAEADALRLVSRGEVDAVVVIGPSHDSLDRVLRAAADGMAVVRIGAWPAPPLPNCRPREIRLRAASGMATGGTMLRADGSEVTLLPLVSSSVAPVSDVLRAVRDAVRTTSAAIAAGKGMP